MKLYTIIATLLLAQYVTSARNPPSVVSIKVSQRSQNSIRVDWENPEGFTYASFDVLIKPEEGVSTFAPENVGGTYRTFTGLESGAAYVVTIQGVTEDGTKSDSVDYTVYTVPPKPSNLQVQAIDEVEISISIMGQELSYKATVVGLQIDWDAADSPYVNGYDVTITPMGGVELFDVSNEEAVPTRSVFTGLTPGEEYIVSVRSKTGPVWDVVYSDPIDVSRVIPPEKPLSVEVETIEENSVDLKTHGPISGIADSQLIFKVERDGELDDTVLVGNSVPNRLYSMFDTYKLSNLKPGKRYTAKVYSQSKGVESKKYVEIEFTTAPRAPILKLLSFDEEVIKLSWNHPVEFNEEDDLVYLVEYVDPVTNEKKVARVDNLNQDTVQIDILGLHPGYLYTFYVKTVLNGIPSATSSEITQGTMPMRPVRTTFERTIDGDIKINFKNPAKGQCPTIKIFPSPPKPTDTITYHPLGELITMSGIPQSKRYSINARCVSNNIESREVSYPVDGQFDALGPNDTPLPENKGKLECSGKQRIARFEALADNDACCGPVKPYNTGRAECCGTSGTTVSLNGGKRCCGNVSYVIRLEECCDVIASRIAAKGEC